MTLDDDLRPGEHREGVSGEISGSSQLGFVTSILTVIRTSKTELDQLIITVLKWGNYGGFSGLWI